MGITRVIPIKNKSGFTVIELIIVIIVIAILTAIIFATHNGIEVKTRNNTRQTDINYIQDELELYASQNGHFPSLKDINSSSWRDKNLPGFDTSKMIDPSSNFTTLNVTLAAMPAPKVYSYQVEDSNGNPCETDDTTCSQYTLTATYEGKVNGATTYVKKNEG